MAWLAVRHNNWSWRNLFAKRGPEETAA